MTVIVMFVVVDFFAQKEKKLLNGQQRPKFQSNSKGQRNSFISIGLIFKVTRKCWRTRRSLAFKVTVRSKAYFVYP